MKKYLALIITVIFVLGSASAQPQVDEVYRALNRGDIANVAKYFDKVVDITINDEQSTYSKSQAEMVIKKFLTKNSAKSFAVHHKGATSSDNSVFLIGDLATTHGVFRVYLFFKQKEKNYLLQIIRFEQGSQR